MRWKISIREFGAGRDALVWFGREGATWQEVLAEAQRDDPCWKPNAWHGKPLHFAPTDSVMADGPTFFLR